MTTQLSAAENIFRYLHWTNSRLRRVYSPLISGSAFGMAVEWLHPMAIKLFALINSLLPIYGQCLVYSFGINKQWSFDEAMDKFGYVKFIHSIHRCRELKITTGPGIFISIISVCLEWMESIHRLDGK
jgi:hypothetical protein